MVVGELNKNNIEYNAVNACISFLPFLNGKQLLVVENLISKEGKLHPVQEAMVKCHGSQCGFCTPGFVMSLFSMYKNHDNYNNERKKINSLKLNSDGRSDNPLAEGDNFLEGKYELIFYVGEYFKNITNIGKIPFLDDVVIKFGISNPKEHYHVPLLVSPWSYSTYRGS